MDRRRDRHRRSVGAAAAERGDAAGFLMDALEAGNHRHFLALLEALDEFLAVDVEDAGGAMRVAGIDRQLPALPGARADAHLLQRDGEKPGSDLFAGSDHGVVFARVMQRGGLAAPFHELVGGSRHGRYHHRNLMPGVRLPLHMAGDVADVVDVGDGGTAEFHD
jgi:hypothetical protein